MFIEATRTIICFINQSNCRKCNNISEATHGCVIQHELVYEVNTTIFIEWGVLEDAFTKCNMLDQKLIFTSHNQLPDHKNASRPTVTPIIFRNKMKFSTFVIAWSKILCCGPFWGGNCVQNYQAAKTGSLYTPWTNQAAILDFLT